MKNIKEIKCVVWDLDFTIWEGILLEQDKIKLKPEIVEILKELDSRGILQSVASRNDYQAAISMLKHFKLDQYFIYPQISWNVKSESIKNIVKKLNIGEDSIMFIDDDEFELLEVKSEFPDIRTFKADHYKNILSLPELNPKYITDDSKRRRMMYLEDQQRQEEEDHYKGAKKDFLASLDMKLLISLAKIEDLKRCEELTKRTNQLNSTGITYGYEELKKMIISPNYLVYICELTDRIGSYGKIGLAIIETEGSSWRIKLLITSCRVMSRGIGTIFLTYLIQSAKEKGVTELLADFRFTNKNKMMYLTFKFSGFTETSMGSGCEDSLLSHSMEDTQGIPFYIDIISREDERNESERNSSGLYL